MQRDRFGLTSEFFAAMIIGPQSMVPSTISCQEFRNSIGIEPSLQIQKAKGMVYLAYSSQEEDRQAHNKDIMVFVIGEVDGKTGWKAAQAISDLYGKEGISALSNLDGSFAFVLIDQPADLIAFVTDRMNSRKLLCSEHNGQCWISSTLSYHPIGRKRIDLVGLGYYLANGAVYNGHTLFEGVSVLDRASIYTVTPTGLHKRRYWSYEFTNRLSGVPEQELSNHLEELLVDGVRKSLGDETELHLSLSGGHDSRAILGILHSRLGVRNLHCFSYALGRPRPGTDPYVAVETAKSLGLDCEIVQSYAGDLPEVILKNAALGQGVAPFCDEMDAWMSLSSEISDSPRRVLFVGEHCFGYINCHLESFRDALSVTRIQGMDQIAWMARRLPENLYELMKAGIDEDFETIRKRCPPSGYLNDTKDFLFLDQRLCHVMLPWRERICGHFFQVRFPFLSRDLLDFMKDVPSEWRLGKRLYKNSIKRMFPGIYRIPLATRAGYVPDWIAEFRIHRKAISDLIVDGPSRLDDLIPPDIILFLLVELTGWRCLIPSLRTLPGKAILRTMKGKRAGNWLLRRFPVVDLKNLLKRLLTVRQFLSFSP